MGRPSVIALDLEGTLISNAMSVFPRPGLFEFLEFCRGHFARVVVFSAVRTPLIRQIVHVLADDGDAPAWFRDVEIVDWAGDVKDLRFIPGCQPDDALLVDDIEGYVHPDQRTQFVPIPAFEAPYPADDRALQAVMEVIDCQIPQMSIQTFELDGQRIEAAAVAEMVRTAKAQDKLLYLKCQHCGWVYAAQMAESSLKRCFHFQCHSVDFRVMARNDPGLGVPIGSTICGLTLVSKPQ